MLVTQITAARRSGAVLLAVLSAALLAGCTAPAATPDGSASTPAASAAAVPAPAATTAAPVSASGTGPGSVELSNPYFPIVEGRERMGMDVSFSCSGVGPFEVALENSGSFVGATSCTQPGTTDFLVEQSQESYRVTIAVDEGVEWSFTGQLTPPHGP